MEKKESNNTNNKIIGSLIWKICERGAAQVISLIVQIILARILAPEAFGVIAILLVFVNLANTFIQKGFASSLVRKKEASEIDYNTAFVVSEGIAIICVIIICAISPILESIYGTQNLGLYLRVISITLLFGALNSIQNAVLVRGMEFKKVFIRSAFAALGSGIISIISAKAGLGVWVLVIQTISQNVLLCIFTAFQCPWTPKFEFSKESFDSIFSFGSKILLAEIISIGVEDIRTLIIGKKYSTSDLAYYDRGQVYPATAMRSIYDSIMSVMLPVFSRNQDDYETLATQVERVSQLSCFLTFPLFVGFAAVSRPFVLLLLTEKWLNSVPFITVFCIYQLAFPIYGVMRQSLYAIGRSDSVLKLEITKGILFLISIIIGVMISPFGVAITTSISMYCASTAYLLAVKKYLPIRIVNIVSKLSKTILSCCVMFLVIRLFNNLTYFIPIAELTCDIVIGVIVYIGLNLVLRNEAIDLCIRLIKNKNRSED